jgi:hypothetical protein
VTGAQTSTMDAKAARRCVRGEVVAEQVSTRARELAVCWLHRCGWTDAEVAARTRMSTYTAARIRSRMGLAVNRVSTTGVCHVGRVGGGAGQGQQGHGVHTG